MKNQVTSIEQSRRLIGLGVPAEKASMGWFEEMECNAAEEWQVPTGKKWVGERDNVSKPDNAVAPAFTVADLLRMLPKKITTQRGKVHMLHIGPCSSTSPCWCLYWGDEDVQIGWQERISFLHLLEDAIEWLLLNGYKLEA